MPTVYEDISFGLKELGNEDSIIEKRVSEALSLVNLQGFQNKNSHILSLGQKKRICLAAALARLPKLLLLDEPTNELDPGGRRSFIKLLKGLSIPQLIVSHDLNMIAETCDRVLVMRPGGIAALGKTQDIMRNKALMESNQLEVPAFFASQENHNNSK